MEKIDFDALRASIHGQYFNYPTNSDPVLEFEKRAADVIADFCVFIVKEAAERETPMPVLLQGIAAIFSIPVENIISNTGANREAVSTFVVRCFLGYMNGEANAPDDVPIPRVEVGDA